MVSKHLSQGICELRVPINTNQTTNTKTKTPSNENQNNQLTCITTNFMVITIKPELIE